MSDIDDEGRTSSIGLWLYAESYFNAAVHLHDFDLRHDAPKYYLYGHSIELTLKAFLRAYGVGVHDLQRTYGHGLVRLLHASRDKGLAESGSVSERHDAVLSLMDTYSKNHEFRYIKTGFKTLPTLDALRETASQLLKATRDACHATLS